MLPIIRQLQSLRTRPGFRYLGKLVLDGLSAFLAWEGATRLTGTHGQSGWDGARWALLALATSFLFRLPRQQYRLIGFRDLLRLGGAGLVLLSLATLLAWVDRSQRTDLDASILAVLLTLLAWAAIRAAIRAGYEAQWQVSRGKDCRNTLIVGAGRAGVLVAEELGRHAELKCRVVGFVDDDLSKQGVLVHGIPVLGPQELLPTLILTERIQDVVLAIPSASGHQIRVLLERMRALNVHVKTVPGIFNLLGPQTWRPELRELSIEDLLRREPVCLDQDSLRGAIEDRIVLITGAGGSIGSEIARQVCRFRPQKLILLGRGENSLWAIERELRAAYPNQPLRIELCDIRNPRRLAQAFTHRHPEVVFHAAAHKHVPFLELHPEEAVENNIFGTRNVLEAALAVGALHFVNISTDKAVNPTNVLGVSKRIAELLVDESTQRTPTGARYVSVRFGNVLGSRGSVVPIFQEQIRNGGPLTVTHPEMTRYFMTIPEASQLVIQAGLLGEPVGGSPRATPSRTTSSRTSGPRTWWRPRPPGIPRSPRAAPTAAPTASPVRRPGSAFPPPPAPWGPAAWPSTGAGAPRMSTGSGRTSSRTPSAPSGTTLSTM